MSKSALMQLAEEAGMLSKYWDVSGNSCPASEETAQAILSALGHACASDEEIAYSLSEIRERRWQVGVGPVAVLRDGSAFAIEVVQPLGADLSFRLELESGETLNGVFTVESVLAEENSLQRVLVVSETTIPLGYHRLTLLNSSCVLIVAPATCYLPPSVAEGEKLWGLSTQLYSVHSADSFGIGDFGDLKQLVARTAELGGAFVGVNPLHAVAALPGTDSSPYSPTSRAAINPVYVDLARAAEFLGVVEVALYLRSDVVVQLQKTLQSETFVNYAAVSEFKHRVLEDLFAKCLSMQSEAHTDASRQVDWQKRWQLFDSFCQERGAVLGPYVEFAVVQEFLKEQGESYGSWQIWPEEFQQRGSAAVKAVLSERATRVRYHLFVQWLLELQLAEIVQLADDLQMPVGLYMDLALGSNGGGAEVWNQPSLYALDMSMGAPPDLLAPQGQNWGLPPTKPEALRESGYRAFRDVIACQMRYSGALRIDHAMSLFRLFWVPGQATAREGAYVLYGLDEMMAILALESTRAKCLLIGEDLGTVPPEVQAAMKQNGVLSYKVFFFMSDPAGEFLPPAEYQSDALVVTGTHDLPTLHGYWSGHDLGVRAELALHSPEVLDVLTSSRMRDRAAILRALVQSGMLSESEAASVGTDNFPLWPEFSERVHVFLARSQSCIQAIQLEDLTNQREQMNLPGTVHEHPNWRRKLRHSLEVLFSEPTVIAVLSRVAEERN